jgi:hypothetical protein
VEVGGIKVFRRVDRQHVGKHHAGGRLLEVPAGIVQAHAQHLGIGDELGDGVHHHRVALLALVLGDELGQADEQLRQAHRLDHAAGALP